MLGWMRNQTRMMSMLSPLYHFCLEPFTSWSSRRLTGLGWSWLVDEMLNPLSSVKIKIPHVKFHDVGNFFFWVEFWLYQIKYTTSSFKTVCGLFFFSGNWSCWFNNSRGQLSVTALQCMCWVLVTAIMTISCSSMTLDRCVILFPSWYKNKNTTWFLVLLYMFVFMLLLCFFILFEK